MKKMIDVIQHKIKVFEIKQKAQIYQNRRNQKQLAMYKVTAAADIICPRIIHKYC